MELRVISHELMFRFLALIKEHLLCSELLQLCSLGLHRSRELILKRNGAPGLFSKLLFILFSTLRRFLAPLCTLSKCHQHRQHP